MAFLKKKHIYIAPVVLGMMLIPQTALAAGDEAIQPVEKSLETLVTIRDDDTLPQAEKEQKELEARKAVLKEALSLSLQETKDLITRLEELSFEEDSKEAGMRDAFIGALRSYAAYYEQQIVKVDGTRSSSEVKALAQEVRSYRETIHNPNTQRIVNFVLVFRNESLLSVARTRHSKIASDINKLEKKGFIEPGTFDERLAEARLDLDDAAALYTTARKEVLDEQTAGSTEGEERPATRETISASFDKIKEAYAIFLGISKEVRTILGID